jgi:hypothetical protein
VHFDGKLLPPIAGGHAKEDRVVVAVTGLTSEKPLTIPKVPQGTNEQIAKAAAETIMDWNLTNDIVATFFNKTAANTGHLSVACVLLQKKLGKELLWLPCRYHVMEILCGDAFKKVFGPTSGPNVTLFRKFQDFWPAIDQGAYKPCSDSRQSGGYLALLKQETVTFCQEVLA